MLFKSSFDTRWACALAVLALCASRASAQAVPGTGQKVAEVGDDFEDPNWKFVLNLPKASKENDGQSRLPGGFSANRHWYEPELRGEPDVIERVETPEGGLPGSKGAMAMRTLFSGVPGATSNKVQQDDLIANVSSKIGNISPSRSPSVVVRVFLPPFEQWEKRTGNSFGFRTAVTTTKHESWGRRGGGSKTETYWPGMLIWFDSKADGQHKADGARLVIRADTMGHDVWGPPMAETGWWTLGISYTPDGQVHYYAKRGVENLTAADHIVSYFPYSYRCERFDTFFFDVLNMDDGKSWSTNWIVDDPSLYLGSR